MSYSRSISRSFLAVTFIAAGLNHFRVPELYLSMIPPWLPCPGALNAISGAAEIAGGIGILIPRTRRIAATGLLLLLLAVFPANIHIAINGWPEMDIPRWLLIARLPFQLVFVAWVFFSCPGLVPPGFSKRRPPPSGKLSKK